MGFVRWAVGLLVLLLRHQTPVQCLLLAAKSIPEPWIQFRLQLKTKPTIPLPVCLGLWFAAGDERHSGQLKLPAAQDANSARNRSLVFGPRRRTEFECPVFFELQFAASTFLGPIQKDPAIDKVTIQPPSRFAGTSEGK